MGERGFQLREPLEEPPPVVGGHPTVQHDEPADGGAMLGFDPLELGAAVAAGTVRHGRFPSLVDLPWPPAPSVRVFVFEGKSESGADQLHARSVGNLEVDGSSRR